MKRMLTVLSLLLAFVMLLSGCSGNNDKPSDTSPSEINSLSNDVEPRKITGYISFEFTDVDWSFEKSPRVTFKLPYDMYCELDTYEWEYGVSHRAVVFEKQTYTEDATYHFEIDIKSEDSDYMEKLVDRLEEMQEVFEEYEYKIYDDGIILYYAGYGDWYIAERYFEDGYLLRIDLILMQAEEDRELAHTILACADLELVDETKPSVRQITGEAAAFGTRSENYNDYKFTCEGRHVGEEYEVSFSLPEGMKYEWQDYPIPEYAPDVCGIWLFDSTGYLKSGNLMHSVEIDFYDLAEHDFANDEKYTSYGDGVYSYEYVPGGEGSGAYPYIVFLKIADEKYTVYSENTITEDFELDEREKKVLFDFLKSVKVSKK